MDTAEKRTLITTYFGKRAHRRYDPVKIIYRQNSGNFQPSVHTHSVI